MTLEEKHLDSEVPPIQVVRREPISEGAVRIRLDSGNWPEGLEGENAASVMYEAIEEAQDAYQAFLDARGRHGADQKLTTAGAHDADAKWAEANLSRLRKRLDEIRQRAASFEASRKKAVMEELGPAPFEPADVALLQEIRTWLRSLPENQRTMKVFDLTRNGDSTALKAVLSAPGYLTGVNEEVMGQLRDDVFRRAKPERDAKHQAFRKAITVADRAVDGVLRYVEQETSPERLQKVVSSEAHRRAAEAKAAQNAARLQSERREAHSVKMKMQAMTGDRPVQLVN